MCCGLTSVSLVSNRSVWEIIRPPLRQTMRICGACQLGAKYRASDRWSTGFGAFYISEGVDDENRTLGLPLDRMIGVGVGVERQFNKKRSFILNLNVVDTGDRPIDQSHPLGGRIVGEYDDHYFISLDIGFVWKF